MNDEKKNDTEISTNSTEKLFLPVELVVTCKNCGQNTTVSFLNKEVESIDTLFTLPEILNRINSIVYNTTCVCQCCNHNGIDNWILLGVDNSEMRNTIVEQENSNCINDNCIEKNTIEKNNITESDCGISGLESFIENYINKKVESIFEGYILAENLNKKYKD